MPITASGSVASNNSLTLTDSDNNASSSVVQNKSFAVATRPTAGPPASPTATDLAQIYGNVVFRKAYSSIDATTGQTISFSSMPDLFCNSGVCAKINTVSITNSSAYPMTMACDDFVGASGDLIKIPAYGVMQIAAPMDGVTVAASNIVLKCATAGQTASATVAITFQR